jgi:putative hydrolase of the HAD superfamily
VTPPKACLVDVYETILTCDFTGHRNEMPKLAGVPAQDWNDSYARVEPELTDGRLSLAQGLGQMLLACGKEPRPELVRQLAAKERDLLIGAARLFDDAIPFLQLLRSRGVLLAFVSNCGQNTSALLTELGVAPLVDSMVLSCEVGSAKPSAGIYQYALEQLGVAAEAAVFVDDQARYCAAAAALGIGAVQISRDEPPEAPSPAETPSPPGAPAPQTLRPASSTVVRSLLDLDPMFA